MIDIYVDCQTSSSAATTTYACAPARVGTFKVADARCVANTDLNTSGSVTVTLSKAGTATGTFTIDDTDPTGIVQAYTKSGTASEANASFTGSSDPIKVVVAQAAQNSGVLHLVISIDEFDATVR